jgi:hypothetical protein
MLMVDGVTAMAESVLVDVVGEAAGRPWHPRPAMARERTDADIKIRSQWREVALIVPLN